jgi:translocation and assembly module TamB
LEVTAVPNRPQVGRGALNVQEGSFTLYGRRLSFDVGRLLFAGGPLINPGIELRSEKKENGVTVGMVAEGFLNRPEIRLYSHPYMDQSAILTRLMESTSLGGSTRKETGFLGEAVSMVGLGGVVPYLQGLKELTRIDDIRLETGQGSDALSLVLGSWLTPDFYVSYGKNLLNESGSFNTRYLLGKGFSIKTETGSSQSGGDIKYEFEH